MLGVDGLSQCGMQDEGGMVCGSVWTGGGGGGGGAVGVCMCLCVPVRESVRACVRACVYRGCCPSVLLVPQPTGTQPQFSDPFVPMQGHCFYSA